MAKNIKYVPSGGLLLAENEDMNKLSKNWPKRRMDIRIF